MQQIYLQSIPTNDGSMYVMATENGVCWAGLPGTLIENASTWAETHFDANKFETKNPPTFLQDIRNILQTYFSGNPVEFTMPFDFYGTPFQVAVWQDLTSIPYGVVKTYSDVALAIGKPTAVRAVGSAIGKNPVALLVPCHRVVGSQNKHSFSPNKLAGYAWGLSTKEKLLRLEKVSGF